MNKNLHAAIGSVLILLIMLGAAGLAIRFLRPQNASAQEAAGQPGMPAALLTLSQKRGSLSYPLAHAVNGIKVEVLAAQREGDFFGADICFDFPTSNPEWTLGGPGGPGNLMLSNGVEDIGVYSIHLSELKTDSQGNYTGACNHVRFPISPDTRLENLQIILNRLTTNIPEVPDCAKAQAKLDKANSGITLRCTSGDRTSGFEIASKPANMDQKRANDLALDAFRDTVDGPWIFDIGTP